jgi:thiamine-phosphate pyrophosphorylase
MKLPRLYAIVDRGPNLSFADSRDFVQELVRAGVTLLQYRNKSGDAAEMLSEARELKRIAGPGVKVIMNDRADLSVAAGVDGVHVGQDDISVRGARAMCAMPLIVGISTHSLKQMEEADVSSADYIAFGPIFATGSKMNPDPVVGLDGLRAARGKTKKPLVAIGGITLENCEQVINAGADAVAVISALKSEPKRAAEEFLRRMM